MLNSFSVELKFDIKSNLFFSFGQPHVSQVLIDIMRGRDLPAFHLCPVRNYALPPQNVELICLLVQQPFFKLAQDFETVAKRRHTALPVVKLVERIVAVAAVVERAFRRAEELLQLLIRLVHEVTGEVDRGIEVSLA